jgi:hypothetical protein
MSALTVQVDPVKASESKIDKKVDSNLEIQGRSGFRLSPRTRAKCFESGFSTALAHPTRVGTLYACEIGPPAPGFGLALNKKAV